MADETKKPAKPAPATPQPTKAESAPEVRPNLTQLQIEGQLEARFAGEGKPPDEAKRLAKERATKMCGG